MKAFTEKLLHYLVLILVTVFAVGVMFKLSAKEQLNGKKSEVQIRPLPPISSPKAPVVIEPVQPQMCEIVSTHTGKIQPWEIYQVGFPVTGRVVSLGKNANGQPLDDGDRVKAGQVIASMDDRVFLAQRSEAAARIEQADSDLQRVQRARKTNRSAVTDTDLQQAVTNLALARAQYDIAVKNLDDATLRAPVDAMIARRMIKAGESVNPNQMVFELIQNDDVLLVVDIPETQIREIEERMRDVKASSKEEDVFKAHIQLEGRDRFGNPWPNIDGEVYRIPAAADARTGLFAVEIRVPNTDRLLRAGMVATANIVTARIPAYPIPQQAVIFRQGDAYLFTVNREPADMEIMYWQLGPTDLFRARRVELDQWIDQGKYIIVPEDDAQLQAVITRGQLRLADQQTVRIMNLDELSPGLNLQTSAAPSAVTPR